MEINETVGSVPPLRYLRSTDKIFTMSRRSTSRRFTVFFMIVFLLRAFEQPTCHSLELSEP